MQNAWASAVEDPSGSPGVDLKHGEEKARRAVAGIVQASPQSLHSSQGIHGSADCTITDWMLLRSDQSVLCSSSGSTFWNKSAPRAASRRVAGAFCWLVLTGSASISSTKFAK